MRTIVIALVAAASLSFAAPDPKLATTERAAIFKAAGFKPRGEQYVRCSDEAASYSPGRIEIVDLNGDGNAEAWVQESSTFCYGNTGEYFVLVAREPSGTWRKLLEGVGIPTALEARHDGWPDIEIGGPGFGKFPVARWTGKAYGAPR